MPVIPSADLISVTFVIEKKQTVTTTNSTPSQSMPDQIAGYDQNNNPIIIPGFNIPGQSYNTEEEQTITVFKQGFYYRNSVIAINVNPNNAGRTDITLTDGEVKTVTDNIAAVLLQLTT
jgi:hypothetical protein